VSLPVVIRPEAQQDLLDARDWYDRQQFGVGDKFTAEFNAVIENLMARPQLFGVVWHDVRAGHLRRFPYIVHYRILDDQVEVLAVLHARRHHSTWQSRTIPFE
jgi:plasmid stabilization system protein ParE